MIGKFFNWVGRFIAGCVGVALGLVIAVAFAPWLIFKTWEWLARMGF